MYAFRDRLQPPPADDRALAVTLMAVAAWALAEDETIDLAPLPHPRPVDGKLGFNRKTGYAPRPGLEGQLLLSMTERGKKTGGLNLWVLFTIGLPVGFDTEARHDGLRHAIQSGPWATRRPHRAVLAIARREARRAGVRGAPAEAEAAFADVQSRWRRFEAEHAEMYSWLMEDCAAGLRRE